LKLREDFRLATLFFKILPHYTEGTQGVLLKNILKARDVAQVVEQLPSKHEALSSNSSTTKKREYTEYMCE
jgi:hypothetical protein